MSAAATFSAKKSFSDQGIAAAVTKARHARNPMTAAACWTATPPAPASPASPVLNHELDDRPRRKVPGGLTRPRQRYQNYIRHLHTLEDARSRWRPDDDRNGSAQGIVL
jgi:hypothetical protein